MSVNSITAVNSSSDIAPYQARCNPKTLRVMDKFTETEEIPCSAKVIVSQMNEFDKVIEELGPEKIKRLRKNPGINQRIITFTLIGKSTFDTIRANSAVKTLNIADRYFFVKQRQ
ncbi:MAG: hypothetical protein VX777_05420 [Chlamydiota bacterium]|nr:hypothetical protein [Chlamydiota bacterium]